jgi:hypothetical protein
MRTFIARMLLAATLLTGAPAFAAQVSVGITIGAPPPPRVVRVLPKKPGTDFIWVAGYWYPVGRKWKWHQGYWTRPPYPGARWVVPHYDGRQFFEGYWGGDRGRVEHNHRSDRDRDRDYHRAPEGRGPDRR